MINFGVISFFFFLGFWIIASPTVALQIRKIKVKAVIDYISENVSLRFYQQGLFLASTL